MAVDFIGNEWPATCMGCLISREEMSVPGGLLYKSKYFTVTQDPMVPLPGFLVIGSNRHFQNLVEMSDEEYRDFAEIFKRTRDAIRKLFDISFVTTIQEDSSAHFHTWFFPWNQELLQRYSKPSLTHIRGIMKEFSVQVLTEQQWEVLRVKLDQVRDFLNKS